MTLTVLDSLFHADANSRFQLMDSGFLHLNSRFHGPGFHIS